MKVKSLIISLILIVCFAGIGIGLYCAWPAITGTITDSKYYTSEDLQDAYDKGFDDAFKNKDELTQQVDYYKELTDTYYISILDYQAQIKDYETLTENNQNTISTLEQNKIELQSQVDNLTTIKNSNEETISDLQVEVDNLENQVKILTNSDSGKTEEIAELNKQITNLNNLIEQLQNTNTLNVNTIASLNTQIESLNSQISNMTLQNQNASSQITSLNNKISELQESINYYEQYIASLENGEQVVATFEFDGSVYNIQIVNKNSIVTVTTPISTDYVIFNYWTVNGEQVDLSSYQITSNTKFVADVTYKYDVKFKVDNSDYDSQIVVKDGYAILPEEPTKAGYEFDGWSLNGVDIVENISSTAVTQNVTYQAVFTKLHTVTFMYEEEIKSTQQVRNGEYATDIDVEDTPYKVFNGWTYDNSMINIDSYKIYADIIFIADITYKYDVKFMVDNEEYNSQIVENGKYPTAFDNPTKTGYKFLGWSLNGVDIVDVFSFAIIDNVTYIALFEIDTINLDSDWSSQTRKLSTISNMYYFDSVRSIEFVYSYDKNDEFIGTLESGIRVYLDKSNYKFTFVSESQIVAPESLYRYFYNMRSTLTNVDLTNFDTSNVTDMSQMFMSCSNLTSINMSNFETTNVVNMSQMFSGCQGLTTLDLSSFDTSNVTDMGYMFSNCNKLITLDLSNFDTVNVDDMYCMFSRCMSLTLLNISNFNTKNVTNMSKMFESCYELTTLDLSSFDTSNVTNMSQMFVNCQKIETLNLSSFNTVSVINMSEMFESCYELTTLNLSSFDTSNVTNMSEMFNLCRSLITLDLSSFDTSNVTNMSKMFKSCYELTTLDLSSFDTANVDNYLDMFGSCFKLTDVAVGDNYTLNNLPI